MFCKKIGICHGKTCGPAGAAALKNILEDEYVAQGVSITERLCCGRCDDHISIVLDDSITISRLSPTTVKERFIDRPAAAITDAKKEEDRMAKELNNTLDNLF